MNYKKIMLEKIPHKVPMFGNSHTRGCATEVKQLLTNDFEVFVFVIQGP
jgi:hypothetical protein